MRFVNNPFTDKLDVASLNGSGAPPVEEVTGNTGTAVPDAMFNLNILGSNAAGITTVAGGNTLTIFGLGSSTTQIGVTSYATNVEAALQVSSATALTPSNITSFFSTSPLPSSQGGTGLISPAAHQLIATNGSSAYTPLGVAANGQIAIGSIGSNPVLANITSSGGTVTVTNGPGTINLEASATGVVQKLTGNTGGAISPTAGNINTLGTGSITIAGSGSTLTTQLTGLTNHNVLVGAGTATITNVAPSTSGFVLTSNGASADPSFQTVSASGAITTITGNSGGAESPTSGNFNILGTGSITVAGTANTETIQLTGLTNHALQIGAGTATLTQLGAGTTGQVLQTNTTADPTWSTATYPSTTTINQVLYSSANNTVSGITAANNGTLISGTTGIPSWLANGTTGQILTATTGSPPSWISPATSGTVTSVSVVTANGFAGSVANPSTTPAITLTTSQTGLLSGNGTAITGTAITQYNVITGGASNVPNSVAPSATSGVPLISQGSSSQPIFGTAVVAGGGTGAVSFTAHSLLLGQGTSAVTALGGATNGQIPIGSTGADPTLATLSAGSGVTITNGAGSITIAATGGGLTWTNVTGSTQTIAVNNAYLANNATSVAFTLPSSATIGDIFQIVGVQGAWTLAQASGQQIKFGSTATTAGVTGSLASTDAGDCIACVATNTSASTVWRVYTSIGNITVA